MDGPRRPGGGGPPCAEEPCYQEPDACHSAAHLALGQGSLWEVGRRVLQTYELVVLEGWEKWRFAVVGSDL